MHKRSPSPSIQGFSLLEMAIVMTIIGLLVGGVLTGKSLIRAAELRALQTEMTRYQIAIKTFSDKYGALPGDMANATDFWGAVAPPASCWSTSSAGTIATCSGDGNGTITNYDTGINTYEAFRAWQHLANAGLISGIYTGVAGPGSDRHHKVGINCPRSTAIPGIGYAVFFVATGTFSGSWYSLTNKTILQIGGEDTILNAVEPFLPVFTAQEAYSIDKKMDDGLPGTGLVRTQQSNTPACATSLNPTTATYDTSSDLVNCPLLYVID